MNICISQEKLSPPMKKHPRDAATGDGRMTPDDCGRKMVDVQGRAAALAPTLAWPPAPNAGRPE